jgi:uncharacterized protein with PhoU and TrkA domain
MRRRLALPALVLCTAVLSGCQVVENTAERASDCVALARDVAAAGLNRTPSQADVDQAVQRLDERIDQLDNDDVRDAATALRDRLRKLQDAVQNGSAPEIQQAADAARQAARDVASACSLPVDQFLG